MRHLAAQSLWIQDALRKKKVSLSKVAGSVNPSDMMTKTLEAPFCWKRTWRPWAWWRWRGGLRRRHCLYMVMGQGQNGEDDMIVKKLLAEFVLQDVALVQDEDL